MGFYTVKPESLESLESLPHLFRTCSKPLYPQSAADIAALLVIAAFSAIYLLRGTVWDRPDSHHYILFERPQQNDDHKHPRLEATRNIAQKLEESDNDCVIFWGSQSGTGEGFARRLAKECQQRFSLATIVADLSDYDPETIRLVPLSKLVVFILSTYGEGDPSDNALGFWDWVTKDLGDSALLCNLRYAAFGLGNSNYQHYNRVITVVTELLDQQGAQRLIAVGKSDDAARSTEEDFMAWKEEFFAAIALQLQLEEHPVVYQATLSVSKAESLKFSDLHQDDPSQFQGQSKASTKTSATRPLNIKAARELFQVGSRNCVHMEVDIGEHPGLAYKTGDHIGIWPTNPETEVENLLRALGRQAQGDMPLQLQSLSAETRLKLPTPTTLNTLSRFHLEICAPLSRDAMLGLAEFAPTTDAKAFVTELSRDSKRYQELISHTHITLGRFLELASPELAWKDLPLSWVIETLPSFQPRYYSISSSSVLSPYRIAITALVAADPLPVILPGKVAAVVNGVATNYLHTLSQALNSDNPDVTVSKVIPYHLPTSGKPYIYAHIRRSKFKLPVSKTTPVIMIAAGTGVAPFRAFLTERAKVAASAEVGAMRLFFGCRNPNEDYIYRDELESIQEKLCANGTGDLKIITAYSRTKDSKVYVQDRVMEHIAEVLQLLEDGASLYVCGRTAMAKEVGRRVVDGARRQRGLGQTMAEEWLETLKRQGKWKEDVWG
ncbi:hypothetical protein LTR84_013011 [Exophiala bonariae]|uniref:NADPH--cytochrome P450 reductase n=1 Tax=Exophiala bonariae TaxID=1690606 RepID=A0AAV9NH36_9EURO|nr:hypothetical protein LTR84_013011 [Exophiala bonariae]